MATTVRQARKDLRYLAQTLRGLLALDDELAKADDLEKLTRDRQAELSQAEGALANARGELATATEQAAAVLADTKAKAEALVSEAEARAGNLNREASAAETKLKNIEQLLDERKQTLAGFNTQIASLRAKLAD